MAKKNSKKTIVVSLVSILVCFAMLLGTTYAWFTDSITSGNNIIQAGTLDIELEYYKNGDWHDVEGKSDVLTNELWEPGATEVAYLRIANAGTLALKYHLGINITGETKGINADGEVFSIADYIFYDIVALNVADKTAFVP